MSVVIQLPQDINRFCRTCMNVTEDCKNSFENHIVQSNELTELCKILQSVTSSKVNTADGLPETICSRCAESLNLAYTFINQCKEVEGNLRNLLAMSKQSEDKTSENVEDFIEENEPEQNCHACQICHDNFTSYYRLSKHIISHNLNKSLYERYLDNHLENCKTELEDHFDDNIELVEERKTYNVENAPQLDNTNAADENGRNWKMILTEAKTKFRPPVKKTIVQCKMCNKQFEGRRQLFSHLCIPNHQESNDLNTSRVLRTCSLCEEIFPDTSTLSLHFLKHALATENTASAAVETQFFFCEICGQTFDFHSFLQKHYNEKHQRTPTWPCTKCSMVFVKESELLKHNIIHPTKELEKELFACVLCNKTFSLKKILLKHSVEHLMKKYTCRKCSTSYCTQLAYSAHLKSHSGIQYKCPTCGRFLSTKHALKEHILGVHSLEFKHKCTTCGKSFTTPARLKSHSEIHTNIKKYVCTFCGYSAHKLGDLNIHMRIHTSERPYKCTFVKCTMTFKTSSHLSDHIRRHLKIRRFKCNICSANFSTNHGMKVHHMQHTGEKPFSCLVCHQKFRRKYHVKVHMKQHQPKSPKTI